MERANNENCNFNEKNLIRISSEDMFLSKILENFHFLRGYWCTIIPVYKILKFPLKTSILAKVLLILYPPTP